MAIDFYYTDGGPFAWRCLLVLEAKALVYTPYLIDLSKHENRTPEFLALNARGTLPILKEGPIVVRESHAIMFYLDRSHPRPRCMGKPQPRLLGSCRRFPSRRLIWNGLCARSPARCCSHRMEAT